MNPDDQRTSCPGFLDEYGVWNNGFECPPLADQIRFCCGSESRRYCCAADNPPKSSHHSFDRTGKTSYSTMDTPSFLADRKSSTFLSLPLLTTCILVLTLVFLFILTSLFFWYRCRSRSRRQAPDTRSTKTNLLVDHFPFSPPHHQFFLNGTSGHSKHGRLHHQTNDSSITTTTTMAPSSTASSSSTSGRIPSEIYFNDWKDFLIAGEQPMNLYPTISSYSNELHHDQHPAYLYHGKQQQQQQRDIFV